MMFKDTLKFLNKIKSKNPKENSKPARPRIKNVLDIRFRSSLTEAINIVKQYKASHVISE